MTGKRTSRSHPQAPDPVRLRIHDNLFSAAAEEMGAALGRLGFSPNIKERRDFSTAIFDSRGEMVSQAAHIPVHLGSMPLSVRAALDHLTLGPGDVGLLNDPYAGGTHLPDLTVVAPVFLEREREPSFYVANRAHHADVGGMVGGSMGLTREIYQEGLRIPPVRYVVAGERNDELHRLLLANMRHAEEREGDLAAQLTALRVGAARLRELVTMHAAAEVKAYACHLQDYSERLLRAILRDLPDGRYLGDQALDGPLDDAKGGPPHVRVAIEICGGRATVDFGGTSPQVEENLNANRAITLSAVFYAFRCLGDESMPSNAGWLRPIRVITPRGTLVDAKPPAAVAAGNVETSQRIVDTLLEALAGAAPDRIPAASQGTMNNLTIAGYDPFRERPFTYYETIGGGTGAGPFGNGESAVHSHMTNTLNTPIEALEAYYPFRVTLYAVRRRSGGRGEHRGGDGIVREIELLAPADVAFLAERYASRPFGLHGGEPGRAGRVWIEIGGKRKRMSGRFQTRLEAGAKIHIETPGGGGW